MAVVGDAYIIVRALTNRVRDDIQSGFNGVDKIGESAGKEVADAFDRGFKNGGSGGKGGLFSSKFLREAESARKVFRDLTLAGYVLTPAIGGLIGVIGALGGALVTLGATLGVASRALIILPGILAAVAQGAIVAKIAFAGLGAALQAGKKATSGAANNAKALEAAQRRVRDASIALRRVIEEEKPEALAKARQAAVDAEENAADAAYASVKAGKAYIDAQKKTLKSIENLNKAREAAKEKIQQLRFETEGGAISEKKARLEFEKTRDALQRVQDLPPNSRARQEAELAFAEADLNLRKAIDRNADLKKEEAAATKAGVEGSDEVVSASEANIDAMEGEAEAARNVAIAQREAAKARAEATKAAEDAAAGGKAEKEINRRIADARQALKDAQDDLRDANAGGGAADAFADAMRKLSPEAQRFVTYLLSIKDAFAKLKAAAGKELFPRLETAIQNLVDNLFPKLEPLLTGTGKVLGDMAINFSNTVTEAENMGRLTSIWKNNDKVLGNLGGVVNNLYEAMLILLDAAGPIILAFSEWAKAASGAWVENLKTAEASGELAKKFKTAYDIGSRLFGILGTIGSALSGVGKAAVEGGAIETILKFFEEGAAKFKAFVDAGNADGSLGTLLNGMATNGTKLLSVISDVVEQILIMGAQPGVGQLLDSIKIAVGNIADIGPKLAGPDGPIAKFGVFIEKVTELSNTLTESSAFNAFFDVLNTVLDVINKIFGNETVGKIFMIAAPILGVIKGVSTLGRVFGFLGKVIVGNVAKGIGSLKAIGGVVSRVIPGDPFAGLRKSSGLTRAELKRQMVIDKQKKLAMKGIFVSGDRAAKGIDRVKNASIGVRPKLLQSAGAMKIQAGAAKVATGASKLFGLALRGVGAAFKAALGPVGLALLLLELVITNWDGIVAFFTDLIPKLGQIFSDMWGGLTSFLGDAWTNISTWWNETFIPGITEFGKIALEVLAFIFFPIPSLIIKFWPEISKFFTETVFPWFAALPGEIGKLISGFWNWLVDGAKNIWEGVSGWWNNTVVPWFTGLVGKVVGWAGKVWNFLGDGIKTAWSKVSGWWQNSFIPWITGLASKVGKWAAGVWDFLAKGVGQAWDNVVKFFTQTVPNFLSALPDKFSKGLSGLWNALGSGLSAAWNAAKQWWNSNVASKKLTIGGFKVLGINIPKIELGFPKLAAGGVVKARPGGVMAQLAEAGQNERVEPLDANGLSQRDKAMIDMMTNQKMKDRQAGVPGGQIVVNVYPSAGMDEKALAEMVSKNLSKMMRKGAA